MQESLQTQGQEDEASAAPTTTAAKPFAFVKPKAKATKNHVSPGSSKEEVKILVYKTILKFGVQVFLAEMCF